MSRANYIIFHPDRQRQMVRVTATAMVGRKTTRNWKGNVWVDWVNDGNEDPFVFHEGWIYSFCHASQLRRNKSHNCVQRGFWLLFCSGDKAEKDILCADTIFKVGVVHNWIPKPMLSLPKAFASVRTSYPELWKRHFRYPFTGHHDGVTHTYEAELGRGNSFLPLLKGEQVQFPFEHLVDTTAKKIRQKLRGKYPVILSDEEIGDVVDSLRNKADTQVLERIKLLNPTPLKPKMKKVC